jgi:hypothetical protein
LGRGGQNPNTKISPVPILTVNACDSLSNLSKKIWTTAPPEKKKTLPLSITP